MNELTENCKKCLNYKCPHNPYADLTAEEVTKVAQTSVLKLYFEKKEAEQQGDL